MRRQRLTLAALTGMTICAAAQFGSSQTVCPAPGAPLVGVPEVVNKTTHKSTRVPYRGRLVSKLADAKLNAAPLAGAQADVAQPATMSMQTQGLGMKGGMQMGMGMGIDPTASAASFLMQQSIASNAALSGARGQGGASFDAALGEALENAAKAVADNLRKADAKKK